MSATATATAAVCPSSSSSSATTLSEHTPRIPYNAVMRIFLFYPGSYDLEFGREKFMPAEERTRRDEEWQRRNSRYQVRRRFSDEREAQFSYDRFLASYFARAAKFCCVTAQWREVVERFGHAALPLPQCDARYWPASGKPEWRTPSGELTRTAAQIFSRIMQKQTARGATMRELARGGWLGAEEQRRAETTAAPPYEGAALRWRPLWPFEQLFSLCDAKVEYALQVATRLRGPEFAQGSNLLYDALASKAPLEAVAMLVEQGGLPLQYSIGGLTKEQPIHLACEYAHETTTPAVIEYLLSKGARLDDTNRVDGRIPVCVAAAAEHTSLVAWLLDKMPKTAFSAQSTTASASAPDFRPFRGDKRGDTLLHVLCHRCPSQPSISSDKFYRLVERVVDEFGVPLAAKNAQNWTVFHEAASSGNETLLRWLIAKVQRQCGYVADVLTSRQVAAEDAAATAAGSGAAAAAAVDERPSSPRSSAARRAREILAQELNRSGGDKGRTPLLIVLQDRISAGTGTLLRLLLDHGANAALCDASGWGAMHLLAQQRIQTSSLVVAQWIAIARMLLRAGAAVNAQTTITRETPLLFAMRDGDPEMVKQLVQLEAEQMRAAAAKAGTAVAAWPRTGLESWNVAARPSGKLPCEVGSTGQRTVLKAALSAHVPKHLQ